MRTTVIMLTSSVVLSFGCAYLNELESWATYPTGIWAFVTGVWALGRLLGPPAAPAVEAPPPA